MYVSMLSGFTGNETVLFVVLLTTRRRALLYTLCPTAVMFFVAVYAKTKFYLRDPIAFVAVGCMR
jgi:hypothetical protein